MTTKTRYALIILLAAFACGVSVRTARAQLDLISTHRAWVAERYADPTRFSEEELLNEAVDIVYSNLQEPEAMNLMREASELIPELVDYVAFSGREEVDTLCRHMNAAMDAIARYAEGHHPGSLLAARARTAWLTGESNLRDTDSEWADLIAGWEKKVDRKADPRLRAQVVTMKTIRCCVRNVRANISDVNDYPLMFRLEKEALDIYPPDSPDRSFQRAELYHWIGDMKTLIHSDLAGAMLQSEAGFNGGTGFVLMGTGMKFPCNSLWYHEKAAEIAEGLLNPGHPRLRAMIRSGLQLKSNTRYLSAGLFDSLKRDFDYIYMYYPRSSQDVAEARVLWVLTCLAAGQATSEDIFLPRASDILEAALGMSNPLYHQNLFQIALCKLFSDPDDDTWVERMRRVMVESGLDEKSDTVMLMMAQVYRYLHMLAPETALEKMEPVYRHYISTHSSSPMSLQLGDVVAQFYLYYAFNHERGKEVLNHVLSDRIAVSGPDGCVNDFNYWAVALLSAENEYDNPDRSFPECFYTMLIRNSEKSSLPGSSLLKSYLLSGLGSYYGNILKRYSDAADCYAEALEAVPASHPDARLSCINNAVFYSFLAGFPAETLQPWLEEGEGLLAENPLSGFLFTTIRDFGTNLVNAGRAREALRWYLTAEKLYKDTQGEDAYSPDFIMLRRDMATAYEMMGDFTESRRILAEDTDLLASATGVITDPTLIDGLWLEYYALKNDNADDWITLLSKLQTITDFTGQLYKSSGGDVLVRDSYVVRAMAEYLHMMALHYEPFDAGAMPVEARSMMDQLTGMMTQACGMLEAWTAEVRDYMPDYRENSDYRMALVALATYYKNFEGNLGKTMHVMRQLMGDSINEENAVSCSDYITLLCMTERFDEAYALADRLEEAARTFKGDNRTVMDFIDGFRVGQYTEEGNPAKALPYARASYARAREVLDGNFRLMTKQQQENYMTRYGDPSDLLVGLLQYLPDRIGGECYDAVIYRTGMQLRSHRATMEAIERSGDPELRLMVDSIETMRGALARDMQWTPDMSQEENTARTLRLADLKHRTNRMEQRVLAAVEKYADKDIADVKWEQIRDRLGSDEAAVEFVFSNTDILALVLRPGAERPEVVDLCRADALMEHLRGDGSRNSASRARSLYAAGDTALYSLLWAPLERSVGACRRIYYSLPGILSTLAFNAFSLPDGSTLFDRHQLVQLTTTGQLVFDRPETPPASIAMMGDILYSPDQRPLPPDAAGLRSAESDFDFSDPSADSRAIRRSHFRHLPFTALEIRDIAGEFGPQRVDSITRFSATESELRRLAAGRPDVLHLATHGYYISPDSDIDRYPFLKAKGSGTMQRSGVALAGAEETWRGLSDAPDDNDGILTASEVAALDLGGTGLVALSACETALGDYSFEGIFGLQRGFKQAGVQSLLVSLWSVNDRSTSLFMQEFYRALRSGSTRYDSWRRAVGRVRSSYPDPYYWAPFILLD